MLLQPGELYLAGVELRRFNVGLDLQIKLLKARYGNKSTQELQRLLKEIEDDFVPYINTITPTPDSLEIISLYVALYELVYKIETNYVSPIVINQLEKCWRRS
jgi:hypothetical protein